MKRRNRLKPELRATLPEVESEGEELKRRLKAKG
jgi:hypothetical protein